MASEEENPLTFLEGTGGGCDDESKEAVKVMPLELRAAPVPFRSPPRCPRRSAALPRALDVDAKGSLPFMMNVSSIGLVCIVPGDLQFAGPKTKEMQQSEEGGVSKERMMTKRRRLFLGKRALDFFQSQRQRRRHVESDPVDCQTKKDENRADRARGNIENQANCYNFSGRTFKIVVRFGFK